MYGPDAFCKLLVRDVETVCMHVSGLPVGRLPKHARGLDERSTATKFHRRALLGSRLLRFHGGVGRAHMVREYIRNQKDEDERYDQMKLVME
jgi:hypothetical protein